MSKTASRIITVSTLLLCALALILCPVHALLDDDAALARILMGARSGVPSYYNVYNSVVFSAPISLLYRILPSLPWYSIVELVIVALSAATIYRCSLFRAKSFSRLIWVSLLGLGCFFCAILPSLIFLQYSVVSAMAGAAASVLMLCGDEGENGVYAVLFALLSFIIRWETGLVTLAMLAIAVAMRLLTPKGKGLEKRSVKAGLMRIAGTVGLFLLAAGLCYGVHFVDETVKQSETHRDYTAFNEVRTRYMDYPHLAFDETTAYQKVGWDAELYELTENWFFLDERINTETLKTLTEKVSYKQAPGIDTVYLSFAKLIRTSNLVRNLLVLLAGLSLALLLRRLVGRDLPGLIRALLPLSGFLVASVYLSMQGRYPQHAFYALALPALFLTLTEWATLPKAGIFTKSIGILTLAAALLLGYNSAAHVYPLAHQGAYVETETRTEAILTYCAAEPENIYIMDYSVRGAKHPLSITAEPKNLFFWGGWYYKTPFYENQLRANGLEALDGASLLNANVYLVNDSEQLLEQTLAYLNTRFDNVDAELVDERKSFCVYRFTIEAA